MQDKGLKDKTGIVRLFLDTADNTRDFSAVKRRMKDLAWESSLREYAEVSVKAI